MIRWKAVSELLNVGDLPWLLAKRWCWIHELCRGGLARWIPPRQYPLRGPMHEGAQMVDAENDVIMEVGVVPVLLNQNLSNRRRRSAERKRSNRCKLIRGFGSQSREKSTKEGVTNSLKSKMSVLPPPQLAGVTSF